MTRAAAVVCAVVVAGCMSLDPIPQHQCGNHVVEDTEDCDGDASESGFDTCSDDCTWNCAMPIGDGMCVDDWHYEAGSGGAGACCPTAYSCGSDARCHAPSGQFRAVSGGSFAVDDLTVAQLDDRAGLEIVGLSDSAIDIVQLGSTGEVVSTQEVPVATAGAWSTGMLEGTADRTAELLGSIGPGVVAFHAPTGPLETFPFTTFVIPDSQILTDRPSRVTLLPTADPEPIIIAARQDPLCTTGTGICAELVTEVGEPHGFPCGDGSYMPTDIVGDRLGIRAIAGGASLFAIGMRSATASIACVYTATSTPPVPPDPPSVDLGPPTILDLPPGLTLATTGAMVFARLPGDSCPSLLVPLDEGVGLGIIGFARGSGSPCQISSTVVALDDTVTMHPLLAGQIDGTGGDEVVTDFGVFALLPGSPPTMPYPPLAATPRAWRSTAIGDLNRDGLVDVVGSAAPDEVVDGDDIDVLRQRPDGMFSASKVFTANLVDQVRIGDVDGDLYDDIVFVEIDADHEADVEVAFGAPAGGAPEVVHAASFSPYNGLSTVDDVLEDAQLDDDGTSDLIVTTFTGGTVLYGSFTRHLVAPLVLSGPTSVSYVSGTAIADLDHANGADVVALASTFSFPPAAGPMNSTQVVVLLAGQTAGQYPDAPVAIDAGDLSAIADGNGVFTAASFHGAPILLGISHGGDQAPPVVEGVAITIVPGSPPTGTESFVGMVGIGEDKPATAPWFVEAVHVTDVDLDGDPDLLIDFAHSGATGPRTTWLVQLHLDPSSHLIGTATEVRMIDTQCATAAAIELDPLSPGREIVAGCAGQVRTLATQNALDHNDFRDIDQMVAGDVTGDGVDDIIMLRELGTEHADLSVLVQCTTRDPAPCAQAGEGVKP